ncbi:MAG: HdeD family acid-resistance protein [Trebonia sp.]|jgi:uncharacterized membrane protein HdeD (DUF308 family)
MAAERPDGPQRSGPLMIGVFQGPTSFLMGLATLILGIIVAIHPSVSLTVIAVLLGILLIFSGVFQIVEAFDAAEHSRVWRGIAGVLLIVAGIVLIRHLHLSIALIGLIVGLTWVVQGLSALVGGISGSSVGLGTGWLVVFGVISLIAGIVVISAPVASVTTLAALLGIWFAVIGVFEMLGAFLSWRARRKGEGGPVSVPGQRASDSTAADSGATERKVPR